jgi:acetyl esterase/lipase
MSIEEDVVFGTTGQSGRELRLDIFRPQPEKSLKTAVLQLHPGGFRVGNRKMIHSRAEKLSQFGFTCLAAEYRLVGEAPWPAQIYDVKAAIRWIRANAAQLDIAADRIVVQGFSAGAHLALFAAGTPDRPEFEGEGGNPGISTQVAAVMALYPPTEFFIDPNEAVFNNQYPVSDMAEWNRHLEGQIGLPSWVLQGLGATSQEVKAASPATHISPQFPPAFLVHGTGDMLVPYPGSVRFQQRLQEAGVSCDLHLFAGQPHGFDMAKSFLEVIQAEAALFFRRMVSEPEQVKAEFAEAFQALARAANLSPGLGQPAVATK